MTESNRPFWLHTIHDMVGPPDAQTPYGRAVPRPYPATFSQRIAAAWWVLTGRAHVVRWPLPGEAKAAFGAPEPKMSDRGATGAVIGATLTGGQKATLTGGDRSTLTGGDGATLTGGHESTLTGGDGATLTGGYESTLTGGQKATLTGGDRSTLTGGDRSTLTGGYRATLTGGYRSTLTGGYGATFTGGDKSTLCGLWHDGTQQRVAVAYVGEKRIEPNKPYRVDHRGRFVRVQ